MADSAISPTGTSRRVKRAARACNHCRWKRLKCSDQSENESCMNCIIYGTKCEYTPGWSSQGGGGAKRKSEAPDGSRGPKTRKKQKASVGGQSADGGELTPGHNSNTADESSLSSTSPAGDGLEEVFDPMEGAEGGVDSSDAVHIVGEEEHAGERGTDTVLVHDQLGKKLVHYLAPMMTGVDNDEDIALSAEDAGLPPEAIAEVLINAYFDNVHPLYPVIDEISFRQQLRDYYRVVHNVDRLWLMLVKLVMCTGASAIHDSVSLGHDMKALREALFMQVLSSAYLVYTQVKLRTTQILFLIALYCTQIKRPSSAWLWCRWAIRMTSVGRMGLEQSIPTKNNAEECKLRDFIQWSLFIIESQLSLSQFRDDPRFTESAVKQPSEEIKKQYPAFCHRVDLARITHKFCKMGMESGSNATRFANLVENLHASVAAWKESLPPNCQPESDLTAEGPDYHAVLLMHVEYYGLLLTMFTALGAAARLLPKNNFCVQHPSARVRNQIAVRINNSRRLLHTINSIVDTSHLKPSVTSWITPVQVLGPFSFLYSHIMRRPALATASSDLELLYYASQNFRRYMTDSPRNKNIAALIAAMYNAASNFVNQARINAEALNNIEAANSVGTSAPNYSELPRAHSNDSSNHTDPQSNTDTSLSNSHEFNYSPTIPTPITDTLDLDPKTATPYQNHHYSFSGQNPSIQFFDGSSLMQRPNIMSEDDVAQMLAQQSHLPPEHMMPTPTPFPEVMGMTMANGWEDWLWQNEMRPPPH